MPHFIRTLKLHLPRPAIGTQEKFSQLNKLSDLLLINANLQVISVSNDSNIKISPLTKYLELTGQ